VSGPNAETAPAYFMVPGDAQSVTALTGSHWPMRIAITGGLEPGIIVTCARGRCEAVLLELSAREAEAGWPMTGVAWAELAADHIPDCMCGRPRGRG
jgi:hypothetical protein